MNKNQYERVQNGDKRVAMIGAAVGGRHMCIQNHLTS